MPASDTVTRCPSIMSDRRIGIHHSKALLAVRDLSRFPDPVLVHREHKGTGRQRAAVHLAPALERKDGQARRRVVHEGMGDPTPPRNDRRSW